MFDLLKMLRKETISDDTLMPYSNMDVYLTSPQPNLNVIQQKSMNPMANIAPPNYNVYINNKQMENLRGKQCSMRQIIPNHNNNGVICNRTIFNSNSTMMNNNEGVTSMGDLYMIAENYNPIEKLTLPVNNGMLCNPFMLPNNQITTEVEFNLTEESLKEIVNREDLDIVLLSRLTKETSFNLIIWPLSISISINNSPVVLDTKMCNKIPVHLPQYIKKECVIGRNVVKFDVIDISKFNATMFQFQIYMVHRPTIEHAKKLAISHAFESEELTFKLLHDICMNLNREFVNVSTICPITGKRIEIAARLKCCTHLQPFDLIAFLKIQARWMLTSCPLCYNSMPFNFNGLQQNIVIDKILQQIFDRTPTQYQLVQVHMNGQFTPVIMHSGMEFNAEMQNGNNIMMSNRHNSKHFAELNSNTIMHASQPMPPVYRPPDQTINFQMVNGNPHRVINTPFNNVSIDSRSMLDLHPSDDQSILMSMQPNMKYPHQTLPCVADKPLTKKPVKRKIPRKATPKTKIDVNPNLINNANNMSNGAITPPSTRTSSVASTSSPDSLNVPHLNHKRPPSIDLLPSTVLSDCHLSIGDDPNLFSTTPISQMNNLSFSHPTQTQQFQHQQFQQFQQQQQIQQQQIQQQQQMQQQQMQQQQMQQQQIQQQQIQQQQIQQQQIQQQQIQQQQQLQQQLQQQQLQQQHYHHLYQLPPEQKPLSNWPIPEQISMQQRNLQQQQQQPQHHAQIHQPIQHIPHPQIPHIQQPKLQQSKVQEFNQQQILTQQPSQPQQLHHLPQQQIQHKSQQSIQDQQQQFNGNLPSHPLYQNQGSYPNSVKQESMHCVPSNNPESLNYPLSVKQDILNYSPSLKQDSVNYPPSVKQESINYPPSVKQESLNCPLSVKQESINYPPSVKQESINYPSSVKSESLQYQQQSSTVCLDNTNNNFTHQQLSNSSCSSFSSFIERILTNYEPVPEVHECSWLDGFNLIEVNESINLSDIEEF